MAYLNMYGLKPLHNYYNKQECLQKNYIPLEPTSPPPSPCSLVQSLEW